MRYSKRYLDCVDGFIDTWFIPGVHFAAGVLTTIVTLLSLDLLK